MDLIKDWTKLELGKFYKLSCGCAGQVVRLDVAPEDPPHDRGFYMAYSTWGCAVDTDNRKSYEDGFGPYCNYFNYNLNERAMPAVEIPKPHWWDDAVKNRLDSFKMGKAS